MSHQCADPVSMSGHADDTWMMVFAAGCPAGHQRRHPARAAAGTSRPGCSVARASLDPSGGAAGGHGPAARPPAPGSAGSGAPLPGFRAPLCLSVPCA